MCAILCIEKRFDMQNNTVQNFDFNAMTAYDFNGGIGNDNCYSCDGSEPLKEPVFNY